MRVNGCDHNATMAFNSVMGLPPPLARFDKLRNAILSKIENLAELSMKSAAKVALQTQKTSCSLISKFGASSNYLLVGIDGSWMKRGFHSLISFVSSLCPYSGKVIDVVPVSKYCQICKMDIHKQANCKCNFSASDSSGTMEVYGVEKLFERSILQRGVVYKYFLGDGDCKSFNKIEENQPYGPTVEVEKLECINHFAKRFKTKIEKLIKDKKIKKKVKLDGKGKLSAKMIERLQSYYSKAIRNNHNSVADMKNAIWATYYHSISTDSKPQHRRCPSNSWCKYKNTKNKRLFRHGPRVPVKVFKELKPLYEDLTKDEDLKKLQHGLSQNCNESFNSKAWKRALKISFMGIETFKVCLYDSVLCHNDGYISRAQILQALEFRPGQATIDGLRALDNLRQKKKTSRKSIKRKYRNQPVETSYGSAICI